MSLQKEYFHICDVVDKPTAKMGVLADKLYKVFLDHFPNKEDICKVATEIDYYGGNLSENKILNVLNKCSPYWTSRKHFEESYTGDKEIIYLDPKTRQVASSCLVAIENDSNIQNLLHPSGVISDPISENEQAILLDVLVKIPETNSQFILKLKSKLDNYTLDFETNTITVNDIKTLGRIVSEINLNIEKYRYNREIAMYSWLLSLIAKKFYNMDNPTVKGNYLVVSTIPNYYTKVVPMTTSMYREGWEEFVRLLKLVANYVATDYKDFGIWNIQRN